MSNIRYTLLSPELENDVCSLVYMLLFTNVTKPIRSAQKTEIELNIGGLYLPKMTSNGNRLHSILFRTVSVKWAKKIQAHFPD